MPAPPPASGPARDRFDRAEALAVYEQVEQAHDEWLKREILEHRRIDLLATAVLGLRIKPHNLKMLQFRFRHEKRSLILGWRGSWKTSYLTLLYAIWHLLRNPNVRILVASRSGDNATAMTGAIRTFLENEALVRIFGVQHGREKWDRSEFRVAGRTSAEKEHTVESIGIEGGVVGNHYDVILGDDLVDEQTSRTRGVRHGLHTFFYKVLLPCLMPGGELHVTGTRYHPKDLHNHLQTEDEDFRVATLVVPVITGSESDGYMATDPEDWPVEACLKRRRAMGVMAFETQMLCTAKLMQGDLFKLDDFDVRPLSEFPTALPGYLGVDLAVSLDKRADRFALVAIAYDRANDLVWVRAALAARHKVHNQKMLFLDWWDRFEPVKAGIESNAFQASFAQELRREHPELRILDVHSKESKEDRAHKLSARVDAKKIIFAEGMDELFEELCLFPDAEHDDLVDALGAAVTAAVRKIKSPRKEVGLDWQSQTRPAAPESVGSAGQSENGVRRQRPSANWRLLRLRDRLAS